jgi:predicted nuclease with TOPRIM domain
MANTHKLDEAFRQFEAALQLIEAAAAEKTGLLTRLQEVETEAESLRKERDRLAGEIELVRSKAGELADSSRNAAGKIDAAMSRIRAVLHSNASE